MPTITIGGVNYDSYATVAEADEYLAADFTATTWRAETDDDQKGRALISASRLLDRQQWPGTKTDEDQTTAWPRDGVSGVDDGVTPQQIIDAAILLAKYIHEGVAVETSPTTASNIKRQKAGSVEQEFFRTEVGTRLPLPVAELLGSLLAGTTTGLGNSLSYGTCGETVSDDNYGRTVGM